MTNDELIELTDTLKNLPSENEWVEFKKGSATNSERLGLYLSGLSNAACIHNQPFAYLIFGVDDDTQEISGTNYGFKKRKEGNEELELWLRRYLSPSIQFTYFRCDYSKHISVEIFKIPAAKGQPVSFKNSAKIRIGSNLTDLKKFPDYIRTIYNSEQDWSAQIVKDASISDLDPAAVLYARTKFQEKSLNKRFYDEIAKWDDETFLDKAKITINGQITNAAILLLGKPESAHYLSPSVVQITWKLDTEEKAYEHFEPPFFLAVSEVLKRIRNIQYKFFPDNQLIATEVRKYDTEVILEALNNCIAHQDYSLNSRILLTENVSTLTFCNAGGFYEGQADDYSIGDKTPKKYRNKWLADAMVNLNMIDTLGYGIHKMYLSQKNRFFPLPDYSQSTSAEVVLKIYGNSIDENYSKLLIEQNQELDLTEIILLDKVQKKQEITKEAVKKLRKKKLIEGPKDGYFISAKISKSIEQKAKYTKNKGLSNSFYKELIVKHLENHGSAGRAEIDRLLFDKLPDTMSEKQKKVKVNNLLRKMSGSKIENQGSRTQPKWKLIDSQ